MKKIIILFFLLTVSFLSYSQDTSKSYNTLPSFSFKAGYQTQDEAGYGNAWYDETLPAAFIYDFSLDVPTGKGVFFH